MRRFFQSALLLGLSSLAAAIFKDEAGDIDFHHALVGIPQPDTTFFHRPRKVSKGSLLYTLSDVGFIAAVHPGTGNIMWRQQIAEPDADATPTGRGFLRAPEGGENWIAAAQGHKVQAWDALNGRNYWRIEFAGEVKDLEIMEVTEDARKDILVLFEEAGATVLRRIHGSLGTVLWEFREVSKDLPLQVSTNVADIYIISVHGSPGTYGLRVTSVDASGNRVDNWSVGGKGEVQRPEDVMFVGANSAAPLLAWVTQDSTKLSVNVLGTKSRHDIPLLKDTIYVQLHAPHLPQSQPHFLIHSRTKDGNKADVFHVDLKTSQIKQAYDLPYLKGPGAISVSEEDANVYFTRIAEDEVVTVSSDAPQPVAYARFVPVYNAEYHQAVSDVVKKSDGEGYAVRSAALTTADNWVMLRNGEEDWVRHEGLTGAVGGVLADIAETQNLAKVLEQEAHTNLVSAFFHRVTRHVDDLKYLPDFLASIPTKLWTSIVGSEVKRGDLSRDAFGFNKIAVLITYRGRVSAIHMGNGQVIWTKMIFPQLAGNKFQVSGMVAREDSVVVVIGSNGERVTLDSLTGDIVEGQPSGSAVASTAQLEGPSGKWLLPIGPEGKPDATFAPGFVPTDTFVVRSSPDGLKGIKLLESGAGVETQDVWQLQLLPGQRIVDVDTLPAHHMVASIGRVNADRTVKYKYLNPNSMVVAIMDDAAQSLYIRLVDTVTGVLLASQTYDGVDARRPISCTMAENWFACTFFGDFLLNDGTARSLKGTQLVVSDLFESPSVNDRGPLGSASNYSVLDPVDTPNGGMPLPWVVSQAWVVGAPLDHLGVTQTRQGIANRNLLAYMPESHGVIQLARAMFDPNRPVGRDPTQPEMMAEGLGRYAPQLELDPRLVLSHENDLVGVREILASPATVESTSLVLAYGLDVFGTRVAPSGTFDILGKGFDKVTLLGTVLALFLGVLFIKPMVRRKQINRVWEAPM